MLFEEVGGRKVGPSGSLVNCSFSSVLSFGFTAELDASVNCR